MARIPTSGTMHIFVLDVITSFEAYQIECERNITNPVMRSKELVEKIELSWQRLPQSVRKYYIREYGFNGLYNLEKILSKMEENDPPL
jgi:hypothetical protein